MFDRFGDNCQYKTIKQYGMNNTVANGGIRRPGAYGLAQLKTNDASIIDEDKKLEGYELLGQASKPIVHEFGKLVERYPRKKFMNEFIVHCQDKDLKQNKSLDKVNFKDFLPNSL